MKFFTFIILLTSSMAFGHGENKPGPHGGNIRMPGKFHTELLLDSQTAKIYLLDIRLENPVTKDSKISVVAQKESKVLKAKCSEKEKYFECRFPENISDYSSIIVKAERTGQAGKEARYSLPLKFKAAPAPAKSNSHSHHNH